jgi:hypothetical protein
VIVPFMDEHLPPSYKRQQYDEWKRQLLDYWEFGIKRLRVCSEPNCEAVQRAKGPCRHHLLRGVRQVGGQRSVRLGIFCFVDHPGYPV